MTEPPPTSRGPNSVALAVFRRRESKPWRWIALGGVLLAGAGVAAAVVVASGSGATPPTADSAPAAALSADGATASRALSPLAAPATAGAEASGAPNVRASGAASAPGSASAAPSASAAAHADEAAAVFRERVVQPIAVSRFADAVDGLDAALALDPELRSCTDADTTLAALAVQAFAMAGDLDRRMSALLGERMGTRGPDVLLQLIVTRGGSKAATRAAEMLAQEDLRARGTPAFRIAFDFRAAAGCAAHRALLERVRTDGDGRMLRAITEAAEQCPEIANDTAYRDARQAVVARMNQP